MIRTAFSLLFALATTAALSADPVETNPQNYKVLFENEHVRVVEHRDQPGDRTAEHDHPRFVLYAFVPFEREVTLPDGRVLKRRFEAGDVMYSDAQTHVGHNVGTTPTHVLLVEIKD